MKGGFSFCGIDIADIGLEYAPENKDTYVYAPAKTQIQEETFDGHDGGYFYGVTKEPKEFTLRCYFENQNISNGILTRANSLFRRGRSGMLIFKRRPWCYYYATVTDTNNDDLYNYENGLFVVTMKAYYPYARGLKVNGRLFCNLLTDPNHNEVMQNTGLLEKEAMVLPTSFNNIPDENIILYNPGTEYANVGLVIAGQAGDGVVIKNLTTGESCRYIGFNTEEGEEIFTDGINGKIVKRSSDNTSFAFLYHDYGYINLKPAYPILRDIYASYNNQTVTTTNILYEDESEKEWYVGKYIFLGNAWYKITECHDKHTLFIDKPASSGIEKTCIVLMNEIQIIPTQGTNLTKISFIYEPTFA